MNTNPQEFLNSPEVLADTTLPLRPEAEPDSLEAKVIEALRSVYDPEIPVNIYDLGLIYQVEIDETQRVSIAMTLTAPGCPVAGTFPGTVEEKVRAVEGVSDAQVELVWEPAWTQERMTEAAKVELGLI
jgi:FeS assembly SUF system protein